MVTLFYLCLFSQHFVQRSLPFIYSSSFSFNGKSVVVDFLAQFLLDHRVFFVPLCDIYYLTQFLLDHCLFFVSLCDIDLSVFILVFYLHKHGNRAEKTSVLSTLINKTNAQEMKWIIMIILKGVFC